MILGETGLTLSKKKVTGKVEVASFQGVDNAVGNEIVRIINELTVSIDGNTQSKPEKHLLPLLSVKRYLDRPADQQLALGAYETPRQFLSSYVRALKKEDAKTKPALPMTFFSRDPSIRFPDSNEDKKMKGVSYKSKDGTKEGEVYIYPVVLDYRLFVLGFYKNDTSMLAYHILTALKELGKPLKEGDEDPVLQGFDAKVAFGGDDFLDVYCSFQETKMLSAENQTKAYGEDRLNVLAIDVSVKASMYKVRYVDKKTAPVVGKGVVK